MDEIQLSASKEARKVIARACDTIDLLQRLIRVAVNDPTVAKRISAHLLAARMNIERALYIIYEKEQ